MTDIYIVSIDQSTTGTKVMLVDEKCALKQKLYRRHATAFPRDGWVEQDPMEIWGNVEAMLTELARTEHLTAENTAALAITNQTGAFLLWDRLSGQPLTPLIGWQCCRGEEVCGRLTEAERAYIADIAGAEPEAPLTGPKLAWVFEHRPELRKRAEEKSLLFGTVDTWLVYKLTNGAVYATECGNASVTQLTDLRGMRWSREIMDIYGLPDMELPPIRPSDEGLGFAKLEGFPAVPVTGVLGDSNAALFYQRCTNKGDVKISYGTGVSVLINAGREYSPTGNAMYPVAAWNIGGRLTYAYEGTVFNAGSALNWLAEKLKCLSEPAQADKYASELSDNGGVYFVPALSGLGAPYWKSEARGTVTGLGLDTDVRHLARAALESAAYQVYDILKVFSEKTGTDYGRICCDGGLTESKFLMGFQAALLGRELTVSQVQESSGMGAALLAGINTGMWSIGGDMPGLGTRTVFPAEMGASAREKLLCGWHRAVKNAAD